MRARSGTGVWLAAFLVGALWAGELGAQQPTAPADSADAATVAIPDEELSPDTFPEEVQQAAEPEVVAMKLPAFPAIGSPGWDAARLEWSREDLERFPGITLSEFIQRIPGVLRYRAGSFGRPEGVTTFGAGGGRVRVIVDGLELDALGHGTYPLETLAVLDVNRIRIDRTLSELRVDIQTFRLEGAEPYSAVELGTGVYQTRLLRGLFSRGLGSRIVGTGGIDIANTGGIGINEEYGSSNLYFRATYALDERSGLGFDLRRTAADRGGSVYPEESARGDLTIRYRNQLSDAMMVEALMGRTTFEEAGHLPTSPGDEILESAVTQGVARAAFGTERLGVEASARGRIAADDAPALPTAEVEGRITAGPLAFLRIEGDGRFASGDGASALEGRVVGTVSPSRNFSLFGSAAFGSRLTQVRLPATLAPVPALYPSALTALDASGWRAGAELAGRGGVLGAALVEQGAGTIVPFGLGFDLNLPSEEVGAVRGVELFLDGALPRTGGALRLQGSFVYVLDGGDRPYLPTEYGRAGFYFTDSYFNGQLEPSLRVEGVHRGDSRVPAESRSTLDALATGYQTANLSLHIRILDVRLFLDWENVLSNQVARDFPFGPPAFPRILYGANWHFSN